MCFPGSRIQTGGRVTEKRHALAAGVTLAAVATLATGTGSSAGQAATTVAASVARPASLPSVVPPARVCGNKAILTGPGKAPPGAITVPAGNNVNVDFAEPGTTYWFAPGVHTLGTGEYNNIRPADHDTYLGAPGAILDGQHKNDSAFDDSAQYVTVKYLTVRNFGTWGGDQGEGTVNHDSGSYWMITHNTISGNGGAGVMLGTGNKLTWNCIRGNQQYGFNAYSNDGTITNVVVDHNEIAGNDSYDYEARQPGCGCSGGGKFWNVVNAAVTSNWVFGNKNVGLWADTDNAGFEFIGNLFQKNQNVGLMYEISYNAIIEYNAFVGNGIPTGSANPGFPTSAIYISESGADRRVASNYRTMRLTIMSNVFLNNWGGVVLWENSNRFCGSPDNSSTGYCTMVDPNATVKSCGDPALIGLAPFFSDCRWKTQYVLVKFNLFSFNPATVGKACTAAYLCGYNGVFSEYGSDPPWSPYLALVVPDSIAFHQGNLFYGNTYVGPWCFMGRELGTSVDWSHWRATASPSAAQFGQDVQSVHSGTTRSCS